MENENLMAWMVKFRADTKENFDLQTSGCFSVDGTLMVIAKNIFDVLDIAGAKIKEFGFERFELMGADRI